MIEIVLSLGQLINSTFDFQFVNYIIDLDNSSLLEYYCLAKGFRRSNEACHHFGWLGSRKFWNWILNTGYIFICAGYYSVENCTTIPISTRYS